MNAADQKVAELEMALQQAREEQQVQQRTDWISQLRETRKALKKARADYQRLAKEIKDQDEARSTYTSNIMRIDLAISEHLSLRPMCIDYLPDDEDCIKWQARFDELEAAKAQQIGMRASVTTTNRLEAIQYEGPHGVLATLERREIQLCNAISGTTGKAVSHGIFSVR